MTQALNPGSYKINRFTIIGQTDADNLEIKALIPELVINESMDQNCIRGHATIIDKVSLLEGLPIRGEERLLVEVEDAEGKSHNYDFFLYKVTDVEVADSNDGLAYTIHFCSFSRYVAGLFRVCKPYDTYIHEMARDIFDQYFVPDAHGFKSITGSSVTLSEPSRTEALQHLVIPNMTPTQAMDFLVARAFSEEYSSSSFRFYENMNGYHFINDEDVYKRSPEPITFTYSPAKLQNGLKFIELRRNLIEMSNPKRINTIDDINSGAYRSEVVEIDVTKKEVQSKPFDMLDDHSGLFHKSGFVSIDFHTEPFAKQSFNAENSRRFMTIKTNVADNPGSLSPNDHMAELIPTKVSYRYHLDKMQISATSHGRLDLTCGQTVEIIVTENIAKQSSDSLMNEQMNGIYIVRSISRQFIRENYRNVMTLSKVVWEDVEKDKTVILDYDRFAELRV